MFGLRIRYLSFFFGIISILSFFNIIYSYYFNLYLNLNTYLISLIFSSLIAISFYKFERYENKSSIYEKILTIFLGYILIPFILAFPFYFSIYNLTFINSFFEAISGFTSTGFTIFENIKHIDQSLILWRSSIQWIGGLYFLIFLILILFTKNFIRIIKKYDVSYNHSPWPKIYSEDKNNFKKENLPIIINDEIAYYYSRNGTCYFNTAPCTHIDFFKNSNDHIKLKKKFGYKIFYFERKSSKN